MTMRLMRMRSRNGRNSTDGPPPIKDYRKNSKATASQTGDFMTGSYMSMYYKLRGKYHSNVISVSAPS
mgnify:CR=1 FL=1